jgi:hypothetical protein
MGASNQWKPILKERTEEKGEARATFKHVDAKGKGAD